MINLFFILLLLLLLNGYAFALMGYDKRAAQKGKRRIPERRLHQVAFLGGSLGMALGMQIWRHKTRKNPFRWRFYLILLTQLLIVWILIYYGSRLFYYHNPF